jgi:hypothetical protein
MKTTEKEIWSIDNSGTARDRLRGNRAWPGAARDEDHAQEEVLKTACRHARLLDSNGPFGVLTMGEGYVSPSGTRRPTSPRP